MNNFQQVFDFVRIWIFLLLVDRFIIVIEPNVWMVCRYNIRPTYGITMLYNLSCDSFVAIMMSKFSPYLCILNKNASKSCVHVNICGRVAYISSLSLLCGKWAKDDLVALAEVSLLRLELWCYTHGKSVVRALSWKKSYTLKCLHTWTFQRISCLIFILLNVVVIRYI